MGNFVGDFLRCGLLNGPQPTVPYARELKLDRNSFQAQLLGFLHREFSTRCETVKLAESHFSGTTLSYWFG